MLPRIVQQTTWLLVPGLLAAALCLGTTGNVRGDTVCCPHCSRDCPVEKVCKLVPKNRKVTDVCYSCKCEDFCVPGCSKPGCEQCERVKCDKKANCPDCEIRWRDWHPEGCGKVLTKKKLVKYEITKIVPGWEWKVEVRPCCHCGGCLTGCGSLASEPADPAPASARSMNIASEQKPLTGILAEFLLPAESAASEPKRSATAQNLAPLPPVPAPQQASMGEVQQ